MRRSEPSGNRGVIDARIGGGICEGVMLALELNGLAQDLYPTLRNRALQFTRDSDRADDLVQSTLEKFLSRVPPGITQDKALPWMFVVMRHLFVDGIRAPEMRWGPLGESERLTCLRVPEDSREPHWATLRLEDVTAALAKLSESLRVPYEMHVLAKVRYREIAKQLAIDVSTVGSRIHRARRQLRLALQPSVPDGHDDDVRAGRPCKPPGRPVDVVRNRVVRH